MLKTKDIYLINVIYAHGGLYVAQVYIDALTKWKAMIKLLEGESDASRDRGLIAAILVMTAEFIKYRKGSNE